MRTFTAIPNAWLEYLRLACLPDWQQAAELERIYRLASGPVWISERDRRNQAEA